MLILTCAYVCASNLPIPTCFPWDSLSFSKGTFFPHSLVNDTPKIFVDKESLLEAIEVVVRLYQDSDYPWDLDNLIRCIEEIPGNVLISVNE